MQNGKWPSPQFSFSATRLNSVNRLDLVHIKNISHIWPSPVYNHIYERDTLLKWRQICQGCWVLGTRIFCSTIREHRKHSGLFFYIFVAITAHLHLCVKSSQIFRGHVKAGGVLVLGTCCGQNWLDPMRAVKVKLHNVLPTFHLKISPRFLYKT